ncbi:hypothetical protein RUM43_011229 [Polyplax serrata]|uniref:Cadherin domain-containing protein n=1 Tax=Polyplax serrata TaxID=468196 RepID=A0AAN8NY14_POLSC
MGTMWIPEQILILTLLSIGSDAQLGTVNRAPHFLPNGDMSRFAIPEDTPPGTAVFQLQGIDPEGSRVFYSISGEYFKVDPDTGIVTTLKSFDREKEDIVSVIISVTDSSLDGSEPNTVSHLRQIPILDINDNYPVFYNRPYSISLFENTPVGKVLFDNITVQDLDGGINGDVILSCTPPNDETCKTFDVTTEKIAEGLYKGIITLIKPLDFETRSSYSLTVRATDRAKDPARRLTATANVAIDILDIQDQPPMFINAPYSSTVPENTEEGTMILRVGVSDGDVGDPRTVRVEIRDDTLGYFRLEPVLDHNEGNDEDFQSFYDIVTTDVPLDRENPEILQNGGIYTFTLRATELINNELPADYSETTVTIVVMDEDDQLPMFNQNTFHLNVSENIAIDSPLPGLNMIITDKDIGENAQYLLSLREVKNVDKTFVVHPKSGSGRTAVVVRVNDTTNLDYDVDDDDLRTLIFDVVVGVANEYNVVREVGMSRVIVHLEDANDNAPEFSNNSYYLSVLENTVPNTMIYNVSARDKDSGIFGKMKYYLRGFGANKFRTDPDKGGIYTSSNLDYESQKSYTLNLVAIDGGNRTSSTNIYIDIEDVNDNKPTFEMKEYSRILREGARSFQPEFYIHAVDADGPTHGGGKISYEILSKNYHGEVFSIDENTGELTINQPVSSSDTPKGQYEMVIRAHDYGLPKLHEDVRVNVRVGVPGNQRPYFKGNARNKNGISIYEVSIKENIGPNEEIKKLEGVDPDGVDSKLSYQIAEGGNDNFALNETTGILKTSPYSNFDLENNPKVYELQVITIDSGTPVPETGTTTVVVTIEDVNNKPPVFTESTYSAYVDENSELNSTLLVVKAVDADENYNIVYRILKPIKIYNRAGLLTESNDDLVRINNETGEILLNGKLQHESMNYIVVQVEAEDLNAEENDQKSTTEALVYIQASSNKNPIFLSANWTTKNPVIRVRVNEEIEKNAIVYTLKGKDPLKNKTKLKYESTKNDYYDLFNISENGSVIMLKKLDYDMLDQKTYNISIRAVVNEDPYQDIKNTKETVVDLENLPKIRYTDSLLVIEIVNINDNPPIFEEETYTRRVSENVKYPEVIFTVKATDLDNDVIRYSISGENSNYFLINSTTGDIMVAQNLALDREKRSFYKFNVTASDKNLSAGTKIHKTTVQAVVEVLDVNDNAPKFGKNLYSAVVPENAPVGTTILKLQATDLDLGLSGEVQYQIVEESEAVEFFKIDSETGEIVTNKILTGKGRPEPYNIVVKASDKGDHVLDHNGKEYQKSLSSDVTLSIYIGDVVKNDGVPVFIKPTLNQKVQLPENASVSTPVFQVVATDPDNAKSAEGQIRYKFLDDGKLGNENPFKIHPESGLISTRWPLDKEKKSLYDLIIVAEDRGQVPQQATRRLQVEILDIDDHKPYFKRSIDESPMMMKIIEETSVGSEVGLIQALDEDVGENAMIDYIISHGNEDQLFSITRTDDNVGVIRTAGRIDREQSKSHLITVKCFKMLEEGKKLNYLRPYNRQDPSERQVLIVVDDIDDNNPKFQKDNMTIGVRLNVPPDTSLLTLQAVDADENSAPIEYHIDKVTFTNLGKDYYFSTIMNSSEKIFQINTRSGELKTTSSLQKYSNGFFDVAILANNTPEVSRRANMSIRIFMLRDKALMKLILNDPPTEVKKRIPELENAIASAVNVPSVNIYDVQFHSKPDGSLDFSSTSSCFQIVGKEPYSVEHMESLLNDPKNKNFKKLFSKFNIQEVTRCASSGSYTQISWIEIWVLVLALLVGVLALLAICTITCMHRRYKIERKKRMKSRSPSTSDYMTIRRGTQLVPTATGSVMGSQLIIPNSQLSGSQLYISKSDRSVLGSQFATSKGSQLMINQPATKMGSQLIINNPKTNFSPTPTAFTNTSSTPHPIIMGTSQMMVPRNDTIVNEGNFEEQDRIFSSDDFGSQMMYEYVGDGRDNIAFDDDT